MNRYNDGNDSKDIFSSSDDQPDKIFDTQFDEIYNKIWAQKKQQQKHPQSNAKPKSNAVSQRPASSSSRSKAAYSSSRVRSSPSTPKNKRVVPKKRKKKKRVWLRMILIVLVLMLLLAGGAVGLFFYMFGDLQTDNNFTTSAGDLGLADSSKINNNVTNIAVFGVDSRDNDDKGRSDTVMIASFDGVHKEIKITSVLRDSRVVIDGHGKDKLAHAYSYGGPELAVKTLNQNFNLDIMEYVTVNFSQLAQIIDAVGGVDITMTAKERTAANGLIASTPDLSYSPEIPKFSGDSATVHLNGAQAVSYARIRKIDDESMRASRQQTVLQAIFDKILAMSVVDYPGLIKQLLPYVRTSLSYQDILGLVPFAVSGKPTLVNYKIPDENDPEVKGGVVDGVWYWIYDIEDYADKLHQFIYDTE